MGISISRARGKFSCGRRPLCQNARQPQNASLEADRLRVRFCAARVWIRDETMNLPNSITLSRIASVPLLIWILSPHFPWTGHGHAGLRGGEQEIIASLVFIAASITDGLDGYLARRRHQITTMGMLLDPLADKLMVTTAYILLVAYNPRIVPPWIAVLVIGREFLVSGLRSIAASEGFTIEASEIGKLKTVIQIVSVVAAILAHRWDYWIWFPQWGGGFIVAACAVARPPRRCSWAPRRCRVAGWPTASRSPRPSLSAVTAAPRPGCSTR